MEITILATIGFGIIAKFVEKKLNQAHDFMDLETATSNNKEMKFYSNLESY